MAHIAAAHHNLGKLLQLGVGRGQDDELNKGRFGDQPEFHQFGWRRQDRIDRGASPFDCFIRHIGAASDLADNAPIALKRIKHGSHGGTR
jgi:hypothetical protein